jgi:hypothetical protein
MSSLGLRRECVQYGISCHTEQRGCLACICMYRKERVAKCTLMLGGVDGLETSAVAPTADRSERMIEH